jgi:hypothetical protein
MGRPHWQLTDNRLVHHSGHAEDCLYFARPLRGDFVFACEMDTPSMRIGYAGQQIGFRPRNGGIFDFLQSGVRASPLPIQPPVERPGPTCSFRLESTEGQAIYSLNGREIHRHSLPSDHDPWLFIRVEGKRTGGLWNVRISGQPRVPESLDLSASPNLAGWLADYYSETITPLPRSDGYFNPHTRGAWEKRTDEIYGVSLAALREEEARSSTTSRSLGGAVILENSQQESLLRYHRPMLEDGQIEYEFFYEPGKTMVHPALDRLVFLLDPAGVKIHWLTDAQYERTGLAADNVSEEPAHRRGPAQLDLKPNDWNRLQLSLSGDRVTLALNGVEIYQRDLEPANNRCFGLFHYADQTDVRVRRVLWRGNWSGPLPADEQIFAKLE